MLISPPSIGAIVSGTQNPPGIGLSGKDHIQSAKSIKEEKK
jgi:hypothetical protein